MKRSLQDRLAIEALVQDWALGRDTGDWEKLAATYHPGALMTTSWFHGTAEAFLEASRASWARGMRPIHRLGGTSVDLRGDRAIAETRATLLLRGAADGVVVDVTCEGRFLDRVERRGGAWRIARRGFVYERDRMDPVEPGASLVLDRALLARFPEGYRHLAYVLAQGGAEVSPDLPTGRGEASERLLREAAAWLDGAGRG
jgi:hypothetical protein